MALTFMVVAGASFLTPLRMVRGACSGKGLWGESGAQRNSQNRLKGESGVFHFRYLVEMFDRQLKNRAAR